MSGAIKLTTVRFREPAGAHIAGSTRWVVTTGDGSSALKVDSIEVLPSGASVLIRHAGKLYWVPANLCGSGDAEAEQFDDAAETETAPETPKAKRGRPPKASAQ